MAKCYWDDAVVLSNTDEVHRRQGLLREWMIRCVAGHIFDIRSLRDIRRIAEYMSNDIRIWRTVLMPPVVVNGQGSIGVSYKEFIARWYALIMLSKMPLAMKSVGIYIVTTVQRLRNRIRWIH